MTWWTAARAQDGVVSHAQLAAGGVSSASISRMASAGELVRLSRGIYLAGGAPETWRARLWAAVLATEGVLTGPTAGRLWGIHGDDAGDVHAIVSRHRSLSPRPGLVLHRVSLPRTDRCTRAGLPVVTRRRAVLELLRALPPADAARLADRAVQRGWLGAQDCEREVAAAPHRVGNPQLRRLAAQLGDGAAATSERLLHRILRRAGITGWVANHPVWAGGELAGVVDVGFVARRLAVEIDGMAYHVDVDRFQHDRSRQNTLVALGWTVLRFTWSDLIDRPGYVAATIARFASRTAVSSLHG